MRQGRHRAHGSAPRATSTSSLVAFLARKKNAAKFVTNVRLVAATAPSAAAALTQAAAALLRRRRGTERKGEKIHLVSRNKGDADETHALHAEHTAAARAPIITAGITRV
ncbi:hypothetical protein MTO96_018096 [Rhipicephalus appendiculatus]